MDRKLPASRKSGRLSVAALAATCVFFGQAAQAQSDFYAGKRINLVVGLTPGGGYDLYARAVAPFLAEHIPGKPAVVVQNMPGAGSMTSVVWLNNSAPRDGTAITTFNAGLITDTSLNPKGAKADLTKMAWLGSINRTHRICYFWHGSGIKSFSDLGRAKPVTMGAIGTASGATNDIAVLKNLLKMNVRGVLGYPGRSEVHLAIERGELDGECGAIDGLPENWIRDKKINIVVRLSEGKSPAIPDGVPWMGEFIKSQEDLQVYRLLTTANELGRPYILSPQVPAERVAILRKAFAAAVSDKNFIATAQKRRLSLDFVDGPTAQEMVTKLSQTPQALRDRARGIIK